MPPLALLPMPMRLSKTSPPGRRRVSSAGKSPSGLDKESTLPLALGIVSGASRRLGSGFFATFGELGSTSELRKFDGEMLGSSSSWSALEAWAARTGPKETAGCCCSESESSFLDCSVKEKFRLPSPMCAPPGRSVCSVMERLKLPSRLRSASAGRAGRAPAPATTAAATFRTWSSATWSASESRRSRNSSKSGTGAAAAPAAPMPTLRGDGLPCN
mmetsp:Transcript_103946/g.222209  ORF Transcript_103946/g.222209 Transcript_103946/m.222209 type:complete len:216 (+) Transcript_103946:354-1001(+)